MKKYHLRVHTESLYQHKTTEPITSIGFTKIEQTTSIETSLYFLRVIHMIGEKIIMLRLALIPLVRT